MIVQALEQQHDIIADCRDRYVRFGMGLCHSRQDVERLAQALELMAGKGPRLVATSVEARTGLHGPAQSSH